MGEIPGLTNQDTCAEAPEDLEFSFLDRIKTEVAGLLEAGRTIGNITTVIAIAGLFQWCRRCGQWIGAGTEGRGDINPPPEMPPPPDRLLRAISEPIRQVPTDTAYRFA